MDLGGSQQTDKHLFDGSAKGERIATPVCALVRNDRLDTADDSSINIYLTLFKIPWLEHPQGVRRICSAPSSLTAALPIPQLLVLSYSSLASPINIYLTLVPRAHTWVRPYGVVRNCNSSKNIYLTQFQIPSAERPQGVRRISSAPSSLTAALPIPQLLVRSY